MASPAPAGSEILREILADDARGTTRIGSEYFSDRDELRQMLLRFCAVSREVERTRQQVSMMSVSKQATGSPENPPARVYPSTHNPTCSAPLRDGFIFWYDKEVHESWTQTSHLGAQVVVHGTTQHFSKPEESRSDMGAGRQTRRYHYYGLQLLQQQAQGQIDGPSTVKISRGPQAMLLTLSSAQMT